MPLSITGRLEDFADQLRETLSATDWLRHRASIRFLVSRAEVGGDGVTLVFRVASARYIQMNCQNARTGGQRTVRYGKCALVETAAFGPKVLLGQILRARTLSA